MVIVFIVYLILIFIVTYAIFDGIVPVLRGKKPFQFFKKKKGTKLTELEDEVFEK